MRRRLVLAIAGVAAVAVLLLAVPLGVVLSRHYRDEDLLRLQRDAVAATREIDVPRTAADRIELPRSSDTLAVYDRSGRRIAGTGPAQAPDTVRRALRTGRPADASGGGRLTVAAPLLVRERVTGALLAQRSDAEAARDARAAWLLIGGSRSGSSPRRSWPRCCSAAGWRGRSSEWRPPPGGWATATSRCAPSERASRSWTRWAPR